MFIVLWWGLCLILSHKLYCITDTITHQRVVPMTVYFKTYLSFRYIKPFFKHNRPLSHVVKVVLSMGLMLSQLTLAKPITVTAMGHNAVPVYANASHFPYANPNAPKGGTLSLSARGTFDSLNTMIDKGTPAAGTGNLYDTLMTGSLNEAFSQYPQLAEKITYDPTDASWIIYHVNPKAKFWDGSPVTAADVKATYDAILTQGRMSWRSYLAAIKAIQVLDKYRVRFNFVDGNNKEIGLIVGQFPVLAKKSIDDNFTNVSLTPLMGSGAYKVGSMDAGKSITYVRDPNYWGKDLMVNKGRNNFTTIKYVYYQNEEIEFEGFKAGQYRFRQENKARNWATQYDFPAVEQGLVVKEEIDNKNPMTMQALVMNLRKPLFADIRTRQALTLAFDFEWMNKQLFYNNYERPQSFFHNSELAATGLPSPAEMQVLKPLLPLLEPVQRQMTLANWQAPSSEGDGFNRANLLKARKLLLQAGFSYQKGQLHQANGKPATLEILIASQTMERVVLPYIRNLKRLGFNASVRLVDVPQYIQRQRSFDYDMIIDGFGQSLSPGQEQQYMWGSQAADEQGNRNSAGIKNKAIDAVIDKLIHAHNREQIILYSKILDRLLRAGYYMVPMYNKSVHQLAYWQQYRHVKNLPNNAIGIDYWWSNKQAEHKIDAYLKQ